MKRFITPLLLLFLLLIQISPTPAQTLNQEQSQVGGAPFTIIFLGTRHYGDINPIIASLKGLPHINGLTPSMESQSRLEFNGFFTGSRRSFRADVASLAANRFSMNEDLNDGRSLILTLKKITRSP